MRADGESSTFSQPSSSAEGHAEVHRRVGIPGQRVDSLHCRGQLRIERHAARGQVE